MAHHMAGLSKEHVALLGTVQHGHKAVPKDGTTTIPSCFVHRTPTISPAAKVEDGKEAPKLPSSPQVQRAHEDIPLQDIAGVYPDPGTGQGCGEGHVFALTVLAHDQKEQNGKNELSGSL